MSSDVSFLHHSNTLALDRRLSITTFSQQSYPRLVVTNDTRPIQTSLFRFQSIPPYLQMIISFIESPPFTCRILFAMTLEAHTTSRSLSRCSSYTVTSLMSKLSCLSMRLLPSGILSLRLLCPLRQYPLLMMNWSQASSLKSQSTNPRSH